MERQLVKHGSSTLMVSLPKKWIDKYSLDKGDSVEITVLEGRIIISKKEIKKQEQEISVKLEKADYEETRVLLGNLYKKGYKKIIIRYENPACIYFIQTIARSIYGFEIIEQNEKNCVIKNVINKLDINVEEITNKIINSIKAEFILIKEYLARGTKGKSEEIKVMRDECWKYRNVIYMYLKESLLFSAFQEYFNVHILEYNSSFLYWLYASFERSNIKKANKEFLELYDKIFEYFNISIQKMKKKDSDYIEYIMNNKNKLLKECEEYSIKNNDRFMVIYLGMLVQNIHNPKSLIN